MAITIERKSDNLEKLRVDEESSMMTDQHIQNINGQNPIGISAEQSCDDKHTSIHIDPTYVEERQPETISQNDRISVVGAWNASLRWENLPLSWPIFTLLLSSLLSLIHFFRPANINYWKLDCNKISSRLDKRLYCWQFLHHDLKHLSHNIFFLAIYGAITEAS